MFNIVHDYKVTPQLPDDELWGKKVSFIQIHLITVPLLPGVDPGCVGPEAYTVSGSLLKKNNAELLQH
jgi:hypothetical protein